MKIVLLQVDKTQERWLDEGISVYARRIGAYVKFEMQTISAPKDLRQRSEKEQKEGEEKLILKALQPDDYLVLLDEGGTERSSEEFASFIAKRSGQSLKRIVFLIGGPYGFSKGIYELAREKVSLSKMTFSHQMVRLFFVEQLYRAFTIIKGEKYHHR